MPTERLGSEEIVGQLSPALQQFLRFERYHLHNLPVFQETSLDPTFDTRYLPQNCGAFSLPCFWVARKYLSVYGRQRDDAREMRVVLGDEHDAGVMFPIHPTALAHYRSFLRAVRAVEVSGSNRPIWGVPTSSTRTLLAWRDGQPERALFLKTSLYSNVLGDRRIDVRRVGCSVGLSSLVRESRSLPPELDYFFESIGWVPRCMPNGGVIVRSIPEEIKQGRVIVVPLFALLGGSAQHQPILLKLLSNARADPLAFVEWMLCAPFAKLWATLALRFGLILEAHAQDLLLVLSPDLAPLGRFYYRDFEGLQVDWELRQVNKLAEPRELPREWCWRETYSTWGDRYEEFVWQKWRLSLFQHMRLFLEELNVSLMQWQSTGLLDGPPIETNAVTAIFSRHLIAAIQETSGVSLPAEQKVYPSLGTFVAALMKVRKAMIGSQSPSTH